MRYTRVKFFWLIIVLPFYLFLSGCKTDPSPSDELSGKLTLVFKHHVEGSSIVFDQMIYTNAAGNEYLVNEIQYFISDVTIMNPNGNWVLLDKWNDIHYVDTDLENTFTYPLLDELEPGNYGAIRFTFGINEVKNQSLMFSNPPESLMFWPELLGGGYHYMKLNGKWLDTLNQVSPFNFHLGIGQIYYSYPDSITGFVQNYFEIELPGSTFEIKAGETTRINVVMNVENWFKSPNTYDHDNWGGDIMQKQDAMKLGCENGWDVFSIEK